MRDYNFFTELADAYVAALDAIRSPWLLMLPALVHALVWFFQVTGCACP